jgi:hypothetical protein
MQRSLRYLVLALLGAILFRYACFAAMTVVAVWNEARPASPALPDLIMDHVVTQEWIYRVNLWVWFLAYVPGGLILLALAPFRFCRYMVTCGLLSLVRAVCITLTGLGPLQGVDLHAGMDWHAQLQAIGRILNPLSALAPRDSHHEILTKDLFFSGHVATTFLLLLYVWPIRRLRWFVVALHVAVVAIVALSRLHYSIDIVAAYAFTFAVFTLREGRPSAGLMTSDLGAGWPARTAKRERTRDREEEPVEVG